MNMYADLVARGVLVVFFLSVLPLKNMRPSGCRARSKSRADGGRGKGGGEWSQGGKGHGKSTTFLDPEYLRFFEYQSQAAYNRPGWSRW